MALLHAGNHEETLQIMRETLTHAGTDNLDCNLMRRAIFHDMRRMHLRHGCRRNRRIKTHIKIIDPATK
ncbi:hypothetical protein D3C72_2261620 [compost metagenome]